MEQEKLLEGIGLTRGEIKVYFSLLELGSSTTGEIIKKARVSRSKVYEMLDKLLDKGLVSFVVKENTKYFEAAKPASILEYVRKRKKELESKESAIRNLLPSLEEKQKSAKQPQTATVYEGTKGIQTIYNEILAIMKKGEEYYAIAVEPEIYKDEQLQIFIHAYHKRRAKKGIKVKLLAHESIKKEIRKTIAKSRLMEIKYTIQAIPSATLIYKNNVATFVWGKNPVGIVTRSNTIAKRYKDFFEEVWRNVK